MLPLRHIEYQSVIEITPRMRDRERERVFRRVCTISKLTWIHFISTLAEIVNAENSTSLTHMHQHTLPWINCARTMYHWFEFFHLTVILQHFPSQWEFPLKFAFSIKVLFFREGWAEKAMQCAQNSSTTHTYKGIEWKQKAEYWKNKIF